MASLDELDDTFTSLEVSIKLLTAIELGKVKKSLIDNEIPLIVRDAANNLCIKANVLENDNDFILWAQNLIMISFGSASITLWEAVKHKGIVTELSLSKSALTSEEDRLCALSYMIRCCFAHGMTRPKWEMRPKYQIRYNVGKKVADLTNLNGTPFDYSHIGGYETLWRLRDMIRHRKLA